MDWFKIFRSNKAVNTEGYSDSSKLKPVSGSVFSSVSGFSNRYTDALKSISYSALKLRADAIASTEYLIYKKTAQNEKQELPLNHWLVQLFNNPNPKFRKNEIFRLIQMYLDINGNAFIYTPLNGTSRPTQMWVLQSHRVQIVIGNDGIKEYRYQYGNQTLHFNPKEIVHLRTLVPSESEQFDYIGKGLVEAIFDVIGIDNELNLFTRRYLANDALPPMIMESPDKLEDGQWDLFQQKWNNRLPQHKLLAVLSGGMKVNPLSNLGVGATGIPIKDANDIALQKIAMAYGIPIQKLLGQATSLASAKINDFTFRNDTIDPLLVDLTAALTQHFAQYEENILIDYVPFSYEDSADLRLDKEFRLRNGLTSINEEREKEGLPPIENGDKYFIQSGLVPLDSFTPQENLGNEPPLDLSSFPITDEEKKWQNWNKKYNQ